MLGIANARQSKKHEKPRVTAWPLIAIFAGLVVLALGESVTATGDPSAWAAKYFLPELAGIVCFFIVGRTRSPIALVLCILLLPAAMAVMVYGPVGSVEWAQETYHAATRTFGLK